MMKLNTKEYFKISFIYTIVAAFPPILQVLIQPIIEGNDRLNAIDFSQIAIAELISSLAFTIAIFAMGNAISRFYYDYIDNKKGYNKMVSSVFNSILFRGLAILGFALIFSNYIGNIFTQKALQNFPSYGYASIIIGINRAINITAVTLYRNEKRVSRFVFINIALGILRTGFQLIGLFYYQMSFLGYVYGSCIGSGIIAISILIFTYSRSGFFYNREILKSLNKFARPLFQYGIVFWGITFSDRFFLESSPTALGIYDNALKFVLGIQMILQGIQGAAQPEIYRFMKDGIKKNQEEIKKISNLLLAQSQVIIALAILPIMLYITFFYETNLRFASGLIAILFMRLILRTQYVIFSFPIYFLKKTKIFFYVNTVVLIVNLLLNYLLVPILSAYGAIIASLTAFFLQTIATYYYQNKIINIKWNLNKVLIYPFTIVAIASLLEIIKNIFNINTYITSSLVVITIILSLSMLYKKEIKRILKKIKR